MNYIFFLLILIILIIILFIFFKKQNKKINNPLSYSNFNDPYDKPFIIHDLITPDYCNKIIDYALPNLSDSQVISGKNISIRNSQQCWINKNNPLVSPIYNKLFNIFHIPIQNAEFIQIVRYLPNQYYNEHHDACCDDNIYCSDFIKRGGQRILTVLIYLNDDFIDGFTYFKNLDLKLKTKPGSAIAFYPTAKNSNQCHPLALHAGLPVTKGVKWIANIWYRENKFN